MVFRNCVICKIMETRPVRTCVFCMETCHPVPQVGTSSHLASQVDMFSCDTSGDVVLWLKKTCRLVSQGDMEVWPVRTCVFCMKTCPPVTHVFLFRQKACLLLAQTPFLLSREGMSSRVTWRHGPEAYSNNMLHPIPAWAWWTSWDGSQTRQTHATTRPPAPCAGIAMHVCENGSEGTRHSRIRDSVALTLWKTLVSLMWHVSEIQDHFGFVVSERRKHPTLFTKSEN